MVIVNIHEAKTQLSKLVDRAARGESVIIGKAGKPLVRLTALDAPAEPTRPGFLAGEIEVPDDFDTMGALRLRRCSNGCVKFLFDAQLLLWAAGQPKKLSRAARKLVGNPDNELLFSAANIWEVAIKSGLGRADFRVDPRLLRSRPARQRVYGAASHQRSRREH